MPRNLLKAVRSLARKPLRKPVAAPLRGSSSVRPPLGKKRCDMSFMEFLLLSSWIFPRKKRRKKRRSKRRASEAGRSGGRDDDGPKDMRLSPRPDREEDGEQKTVEEERKRQKKNGQEQERNRVPGDHLFSLVFSILCHSPPSVNKKGFQRGSSLPFAAKGRL